MIPRDISAVKLFPISLAGKNRRSRGSVAGVDCLSNAVVLPENKLLPRKNVGASNAGIKVSGQVMQSTERTGVMALFHDLDEKFIAANFEFPSMAQEQATMALFL